MSSLTAPRVSRHPKVKHTVPTHTSGVLVMAPEVPALGRVILLVGCANDELGATVTVAARQERRS